MNLDSQTKIEKFDKGKILASIRMLPDQMEQAWEEIKKIKLPGECSNANNVVVCGMGGSALGGRIIDSLLADRVRVPIEIFTQYNVPNYVNSKTLVLASSYSGNTEETISMVKQAMDKKARIIGVSTGGKLEELLKKNSHPIYVLNPKANPSSQPRMGLGYSISATLAILARCGFIHLTDDEFYKLAVMTRAFIKELDQDIPAHENLAKTFSKKIHRKAVMLISAEHLEGAAYAFKNQLNENSKAFSAHYSLPELNHHLLEGLKFPIGSRGIFHFLILSSNLYNKRVIKRLKLTKDVIEKNAHSVSVYPTKSKTKLSQIFEILTFGSFVSFYLAMLYGINPNEIPWVDYFKKKLA
jgi:glucose/mannose-6-phosphate isomerase